MTAVDPTPDLRGLVSANREAILRLARAHRGTAVRVFGSVARGDASESSDIDFLVDFEPGSSLFDVLHLSADLRDLLGVDVDVVSSGGLKPRDTHIRREAVEL
ncbi:MAG: nucleotidyltransferase family protein [Acidimicrobiales bacterium]